MPGISKEEITEMDRLRRIMGGDLQASKESTSLKTGTENNNSPVVISKGPSQEDVQEMDRILKAFNQRASVVAEEAQENAMLQEAIVTEPIKDGVKIGNWKIKKVMKEGITKKDETFYKVFGSFTGQNVDKLLMIQESAEAIVRLLNRGFKLTNKLISEVIDLDQEYQRVRHKALVEKVNYHKVQGTNFEWKQDLYEAKYDAAKSRALYIRERIKNILLKID